MSASITLHCCWLVDPWRASNERYLAAWRALGWDVVVFTMEPIEHLPCLGVDHRCALDVAEGSPIEVAFLHAIDHKDHATAADLFRYECLLKYGGAYSDIDVMPLAKSDRFASRSWPGFGLNHQSKLEIRFITTSGPGDPLVRELRDTAARNADAFIHAGGWAQARAPMREVLSRTGPKMARVVVERFARAHGIRYEDLVLTGAVNDRTPENTESHFMRKAETILGIVRERASGLPDPSRPA